MSNDRVEGGNEYADDEEYDDDEEDDDYNNDYAVGIDHSIFSGVTN